MSLNKTLYGDYDRLIKSCLSLAGDIPTVPNYGMGPFSNLSIARDPALLTSMASRALAQGKIKVDQHRGQCIQNSVNNHINNDPLFRLPLRLDQQTTTTTQPQLRPRSPQPFSFFIAPVSIPELHFLDDCIKYCIKRVAYLERLRQAARKRDEWTSEIEDFYKTGIVKDNDGELQALERTKDGKGRQIKRNYLAAFFTEVKDAGLFSNDNETTKAVEQTKNKMARTGRDLVADVIHSAARNNFSGAINSLTRRIDGFNAARGNINSFKNELSNYINSNSACSTSVMIDPVSLVYRLGH